MTITDEELNAYLDGELDAAGMDAIDRALASDETVVRRLEALAQADRAYRSEMAAIDALPLPKGIEDLLADPPAEASTNVIAFPLKERWQRLRPVFVPAAAAASLAAIIGFGAGSAFGPAKVAPEPFDALSRGAPAVVAVLDGKVSGERVSIGQGMTAQVHLTFPAEDGQLCREFDVSSSKSAAAGVACRNGDRWDVRLAARQPAPAEATGYVTAASADDPVFGRAVDAMMAADPLDPAAEAEAIKNGWSEKK